MWIGTEAAHREEGVDNVCLYGAQRLVSDHNEDLLLLFQINEVTEPGLLCQSAQRHNTLPPIVTIQN